ncbi:hypothetical protein AN958_06964 [Leucoagaricus sp. SymC.cos]|nr:hypothetical protein AN958_06964 [Leucoagaricus sp. SymC.cos]
MWLWHCHLEHMSPASICSMYQNDLIKGLNVNAPKDFDHVCAGYAHGKSHLLPLPNSSTNQYLKMDLVIMDLTGPLNIPTWDGNIYALVLVEASCQYPVG